MAEPFYVPPRRELSQGDIYRDTPSLEVVSRPLSVARRAHKDIGSPPLPTFRAHAEDAEAPRQGFHWALDPPPGEASRERGEIVYTPSYRGLVMVLTHDCELDNDPDFRILAMIRPLSALASANRADTVGLAIWPYFPLAAQSESPEMAPSFVDFRRLTTARAAALRPEDRYASISDVVREAIALRFWTFLFRRVLAPGEL